MDNRKFGQSLLRAVREELRQVVREELEPIRQELYAIHSQLGMIHNPLREMPGETSSNTPSVNTSAFEPNPTAKDDDVQPVNDYANADLDNTWSRVLMLVGAQTNERQFETWFGDSRVDRYDAVTETVFVTTNSQFTRMWLQSHYVDLVESALGAVTDRPVKVEFVYRSNESVDVEK